MPGKMNLPRGASGTKRVGRGINLPQGEMNKTEAAYAERLESMRLKGDILWYRFDCMKLRLADKTFYTPDFLVMSADGTLELHEVKAFMIEDDAAVKMKVAANTYPFRFILAQRKRVKDPWTIRTL